MGSSADLANPEQLCGASRGMTTVRHVLVDWEASADLRWLPLTEQVWPLVIVNLEIHNLKEPEPPLSIPAMSRRWDGVSFRGLQKAPRSLLSCSHSGAKRSRSNDAPIAPPMAVTALVAIPDHADP